MIPPRQKLNWVFWMCLGAAVMGAIVLALESFGEVIP